MLMITPFQHTIEFDGKNFKVFESNENESNKKPAGAPKAGKKGSSACSIF